MISDEEAKKLKDKLRKIEEENFQLKKELKKIAQEKGKLQKEFEEFKAKHSITVDNLKRAMNIKPNSKIEPKPLGAPKGHKPYTRHIPERIDYVKQHIPNRCPDCNTKLTGKPKRREAGTSQK